MITTPTHSLSLSQLIEQLSWGESDDLEFKSAKGGLPGSLWESYSAMANSRGGIILLGVEDDGSVSGVQDPVKLTKDFWSTLNNKGKVSHSLLKLDDIQIMDHPDGKILAIHVPMASYRERPIFIGQNPLTGTFRRYADGDYHCRADEVRRMISDSSDESADSRVIEPLRLDDLDPASIEQYRNRFSAFHPSHAWLAEKTEVFLLKLGALESCEIGHEKVTLAGLLMFGNDDAIRKYCPTYFVDYREKLSEDEGVRWTDRLIPDGTWNPNLYQFYIKVFQKLSSDLKLPFQLDENLFRKGESVVHVAVREALVNSMIHCDYRGDGGIVVEKYRDRFVFANPGSLLISLDQLLHGGASICRNKSLQLMFMMIGAAEHAGSGIDKIRAGWHSQHWREPLVRETIHPDRVIWNLPMISLIPEESSNSLKAKFGEGFSRLSPHEVQVLVTADLEGVVDNSRLRQVTGLHPSNVTNLLQDLVNRGMLVPEGRNRWTRYVLPHTPPYVLSDSSHKEPDSSHKLSNMDQSAENQWNTLLKIASPYRESLRLPPEKVKDLISNLCQNQWLTAKQLSELTNRNQTGLRFRYLSPMVSEGHLILKYPDKPNRTDQAYKAAESKLNPK